MDATRFAHCVQAGDTASLVKLPGVGKKTAERLVVEMRDRLADWEVQAAGGPAAAASARPDVANPVEEAVSALVALGYKPQEASRMVRAIDSSDLSTENIIRAALQATVKL
jgi:Holliday junction DNA helicase RuvA